MLIVERQARLQETLARKGMSDLDSLAAELGVSQSTVRRDVEALEELGLAKRTHGGVIWVGDRSGAGRSYVFEQRLDVLSEAKAQMARLARTLVQPGQTILLDGGTTTFHLAQQLKGMSVQLVTNSLPIAHLFLNDEKIELILTGGLLYPRYGVLLGPTAEPILEAIHPQIMFLSVAGVQAGSLFNQNLLLVQSEQHMMRQAQRVVLMVDSGKFGQQALVKLCELSEIDVVVTDAGLSEEYRQQVRDAGVELLIADNKS